MSSQFGKLKQKMSSFVLDNQDINELKIAVSAAIAISVVIMQAFIGTGITDSTVLTSVIGFSIAIPLLALFLLMISISKVTSILASIILFFVGFVGACAVAVGITTAFFHLSPIAGYVFTATLVISVLIYILLVDRLE